jgi:GT2 family glycosyltransferase
LSVTGSELPFVSVVVPVRNGERTLRDCLFSILQTDYRDDRREIVVVDNGSSDGTAQIIRRFPVRYVLEERRGLSEARNRGIAESAGEVLVFTDADCVVTTNWLRELLQGFEESPGAAVVAGEVVAYPPQTPVERYLALRKPSYMNWSRAQEHTWFQFGNAAVRRPTFDAVGRFDTRFRGACEDVDFCWRLLRAGLELSWRPGAIVFHRNRASMPQLFRQQRTYGRSHAALLRKYPDNLAWTWGDEVTAWRDIGKTAQEAGRLGFGGSYPSIDLVRKLGQRVGFLEGLVREKARRG